MALCQLKAGTPSNAAKLCDTALNLLPSAPEDALKEAEDSSEAGFTLKDLEKVLYRRASARSELQLWDEAIVDLDRLLKFNPENKAAVNLRSSVKAKIGALHAAMSKQLRKGYQQ